jgi:hypothetical protein
MESFSAERRCVCVGAHGNMRANGFHSGTVVRNDTVVGLEWWRSMTTGMMVLNFGMARSRAGVEAKNRVE